MGTQTFESLWKIYPSATEYISTETWMKTIQQWTHKEHIERFLIEIITNND